MPGRGGAAGRTGCDGSGRGPPIGAPGRGGMPAAGPRRRRPRRGAGRSRLRRGGTAQISRGRLRRGRTAAARPDARASGGAAAPAAPGRSVDPRPAGAASAARRARSARASPDAAAPGRAARRWRRGARRGRFRGPALRHVRGDGRFLDRRSARRPAPAPRRIRPAPRRPAPVRARNTPAATGAGTRTASAAAGGAATRFGRRLRRLDQARRRQRGGGRLGRLRRPAGRFPSLRGGGRVGKRRVRRHGQVALPRHARDELARDDLFDRARCALHLDAVIALEQRHHFLARGVEELRDFVNPDSCHSDKVLEVPKF